MLVLSTAKPSISGNPPKLTTKTIDFLENKPVYDYRKEKKSRIISAPLLSKEKSEEISACLTTTAEESVTCTLFNIPRFYYIYLYILKILEHAILNVMVNPIK